MNSIRKYILSMGEDYSTFDDDEAEYTTEPYEIAELTSTMFGPHAKVNMVNGNAPFIRELYLPKGDRNRWVYSIIVVPKIPGGEDSSSYHAKEPVFIDGEYVSDSLAIKDKIKSLGWLPMLGSPFKLKLAKFTKNIKPIGYNLLGANLITHEHMKYREFHGFKIGDTFAVFKRRLPISSGTSHELGNDMLMMRSPRSDIRGQLIDPSRFN